MQVAILSDIHGNRHAFEAVLADGTPLFVLPPPQAASRAVLMPSSRART